MDDPEQAEEDRGVGLLRVASTPDEAATKIQQYYRKHRLELALRHRSFSKFGQEAFDLIKRYVSKGESGRGLYEENIVVKARLILHFDINKTVLMSDKAQDASTDHMVNMLLSECAWGRLEPGPKWVPVGRLATDRPSNDPQLMTYRSYLDSFLLPFRVGSSPESERYNSRAKHMRQSHKRKFTEPREPGEMFRRARSPRGVYEQLKAALALPCESREAAGSSDKGQYLFSEGARHILPSFFNLLKHLQAQKRDFSIIFRTFGADIIEVVDEMNLFATGQHPCYPEVRMDGSDGSATDLRMSVPESTGAFVRTTAKVDGSVLLEGASEEVLKASELSRETLQRSADAGQGRLLSDFISMHAAVMAKTCRGNRAYAIRDYYPFWKSRNERSRAGKLLLLDAADQDVIQIFFDDNIGHGAAHIVDVRDVLTGEGLAFQARALSQTPACLAVAQITGWHITDVVGRHIVKVEPLNAILDPQYFVRAVHGCVLAVLRARSEMSEQHSADNSGFSVPGAIRERESSVGPIRRGVPPPAHHSRRARDLWSLVHTRLTAMIRLRNAMQDKS
ncbi:hypothetical protein COCSUDRAFT_66025 [Coccomyxa subellipsoidea C-169]|uniref:Uncharacterized protein n=1 Tax=Coccomyxa subellipsoidea (strain C-169) TaxID=574566 RepID=I0YZ28_COCSC|nr:hypothetical protein COCSUDRAFT_66025 [Coccomyxa subellipsoidea C-169]EIE23647.1 hypothetical protein COCSUDRAFT_66025 [Coccomyxa subellipsoidea C-169]|eukprot:XP_005648191.1 hypothetical protein COCSUDRAFT_66025 [Coccomyxa subellipsoidea C-169]